MTKQLHICALGSSFAAGPGISPIIDKHAMRSGNNYAHLLANKLNARLTDLSVSGATLENIIDQPQTVNGREFSPQLNGVPADADIVTITAGGNDMSYIGSMMQAEIEAMALGSVLEYLLPDLVSETRLKTADSVAKRFVDIIDGVRKVLPNARIFLVEYLTLLGKDTIPGTTVRMSEEKVEEHKNLAEVLNQGYNLAQQARSDYCEVVPMAKLSEEHGLGSKEPWVDGFTFLGTIQQVAPFHPNAQGHQAVADILYANLRKTSSP